MSSYRVKTTCKNKYGNFLIFLKEIRSVIKNPWESLSRVEDPDEFENFLNKQIVATLK